MYQNKFNSETYVMILFIILWGVGFFSAMTTSINNGLPMYVPRTSMGVIDLVYRFIKGVWFVCIFITLDAMAALLGVGLLWAAWGIKKIARKCFYWDYLH